MNIDAVMRAIIRAYAAVAAYYRLARVIVMAYCLYYARFFAAPAAYAFIRVQQYPAALAQAERARRADLGAMRLPACMTHRSYKLSGKPAARPYMYRAFPDRMVFPVDDGAYQHARKATETFVHFIRFYYLCQNTSFLEHRSRTGIYRLYQNLAKTLNFPNQLSPVFF